MSHKPLGISIHIPILLCQALDLITQNQIRRQAEDPSQLVFRSQASEEGHCATL